MKKKGLLIGMGIIIIIIIVVKLFGLFDTTKLKLQSNTVSYVIGTYNGDNATVDKKIIKKDDINKLIDYCNSLVLTKSDLRPKEFSMAIEFYDHDNNTIYSIIISNGSHVLWLGNKTYVFDGSVMEHLIDMLASLGENSSEGYFD